MAVDWLVAQRSRVWPRKKNEVVGTRWRGTRRTYHGNSVRFIPYLVEQSFGASMHQAGWRAVSSSRWRTVSSEGGEAWTGRSRWNSREC